MEKNLEENQGMESAFFVTLKIDFNKCNNCGACTKVCQLGVLVMQNNELQVVEVDQCNKCAACLKRCLQRAISLNG